MLQQLYIKNFTLIDELEIDFGRGFSVITGETGAGKSIILGAIGLLLGNRADAKQIKRGESKCVIEAHFDLSNYHFTDFFQQNDIDYDPEDCILRREVNANGKSRGFINDIPVSLSLMKELGEHLIDIHSQHQNLLLQKEDFMLGVIDILAANQVQRASYRQAYEKRSELRNRLDALKRQIEKARENEDFIRYQCQELEKANLHEGEQEQLEQESETLEHAEEIKSALFGANNLLTEEEGNVVERLKNTINSLHGIEKVYPCVTELAERLESAYIEVKDIAGELGSKADRIDFNPEALDIINAKLDLIYSLQQKHHVSTVDELIALYAKLKQQLEGLDHSEENLAELENAYEAANQTLAEGLELSPLGGGSAMLGLPGDFTPPSRFIRAAFFSACAPQWANGFESVMQAFHILNNFDIPIGAQHKVGQAPAGLPSATQFTAATDLASLKFYYRTAWNQNIRCIDLKTIDFRRVKYRTAPLDSQKQQPVEYLAIK